MSYRRRFLRTWSSGVGFTLGRYALNINDGGTWDMELAFFWKTGAEKTPEFHGGWVRLWWNWWPLSFATWSSKEKAASEQDWEANRRDVSHENVRSRLKRLEAEKATA